MYGLISTRIQLCGPLVVQLRGEQLKADLPGKQGKVLFAYLVLNRTRHIERDELLNVLWAQMLPMASESSLNALISKLRKALGSEVLRGRSAIRLDLDDDAWVDCEAAREGLHRAEAALVQKDWFATYSAANVAQKVARRRFLLGLGNDSPWVEDTRRQISEMLLPALEYEATACFNIGGTELKGAERAARELIEKAPYREAGYRLLMETLAKGGNYAEALRIYEEVRKLFRDELGADPGPDLQALHVRLLQACDSGL
ncbi:MAG: BTAD domain-containing putative transcriptional regulator [Actinomycetota bacterium]